MYENVLWVFNAKNPEILGSHRLSGLIPAKHLGIKTGIFLRDTDSYNFLNIYKNLKLIILAKPFDREVLDLVKLANKKNIKIISTFDDWSDDQHREKFKERLPYWTEIAEISSSIVVKTNTAAEVLNKKFNRKINVIEDCIEFKSDEPISHLREPPELCWFGHYSNHDTILEGLKQLQKFKKPFNLRVISNNFEPLTNELRKFSLMLSGKIKFINWNLNYNKEIIKSDIVIIPVIMDKRRLVKSHNRMTESINLGKLVIANETPYYKEMQRYCYLGNISEGLDWAYKNQKKINSIILKGQKYINARFSKEKISKKWSNLIQKNLNTRIRI
ncbi:MAG: hypothetical protein CFH21_00746 [Alphaproteobacteria bacterium MarineAlpha5_Bin11]|nr:hypothetical protein [Pelagibacteraceae bacterium]PPR43555.1 MAG: hypothetical protein CFH21_00746 [Alphaproteobacteria bacterium MarineAlpha5_Bin11]PPR51895.1 MAG: hypothetical protein CFH20_00314 [Alphaproteobacteria bacterium MarineAlpha5_Bin10]|tara:strand:+ start:216 stop:1205 length:990 start_codon:yes stop_codon:yes gene_type:complete